MTATGQPRPTLATPCATEECGHTYNWHVPGGVCQVGRCVCKKFTTQPAAD